MENKFCAKRKILISKMNGKVAYCLFEIATGIIFLIVVSFDPRWVIKIIMILVFVLIITLYIIRIFQFKDFLSSSILELTIENDKVTFSTYDWFPYLYSREYTTDIDDIISLEFHNRKDKFKRDLTLSILVDNCKKQFILFDNTGMNLRLISTIINDLKKEGSISS